MEADKGKYELLVIGGSAGSLSVVLKIIRGFTNYMKLAVIIVFHRKSAEDSTLLDVLATRTTFAVRETDDKDEILPGTIYIAPADYHVLIEKDKTITLDYSEKINYSRPSIDVTFETAAEVYKDRAICMLLSGANADGVEGLISARSAGAFIVVQDPASAEVPYMPLTAVQKVPVDLLINYDNLQALHDILV